MNNRIQKLGVFPFFAKARLAVPKSKPTRQNGDADFGGVGKLANDRQAWISLPPFDVGQIGSMDASLL
jgi:hypothetical protein